MTYTQSCRHVPSSACKKRKFSNLALHMHLYGLDSVSSFILGLYLSLKIGTHDCLCVRASDSDVHPERSSPTSPSNSQHAFLRRCFRQPPLKHALSSRRRFLTHNGHAYRTGVDTHCIPNIRDTWCKITHFCATFKQFRHLVCRNSIHNWFLSCCLQTFVSLSVLNTEKKFQSSNNNYLQRNFIL